MPLPDRSKPDPPTGTPGAKPRPAIVALWRSAPAWTPEEGVALACGLDPNDVIAQLPYNGPELRAEQPAGHFVSMAHRAVGMGELANEAAPDAFLHWAEVIGLAFHRDWLEACGLARSQGKLVNRQELLGSRLAALRPRAIARWAKAPSWTPYEGVRFSMDLAPDLIDIGEEGEKLQAPLRDEFLRRIEFADRALRRHEISAHPTPRKFLNWARSVGFPFSDKWEAAIPGTFDEDVAPPKSPAADASESAEIENLSTRERESLLKLIIGMAVEQYDYDPRATRNSATANIVSDLNGLGIALDPDTVRKWLKQASELLPPAALDDC